MSSKSLLAFKNNNALGALVTDRLVGGYVYFQRARKRTQTVPMSLVWQDICAQVPPVNRISLHWLASNATDLRFY